MNEVSSVKKEDFFRWLILLSGLLLYLVWEYELGCRIVDKTLEKIENKIKKNLIIGSTECAHPVVLRS